MPTTPSAMPTTATVGDRAPSGEASMPRPVARASLRPDPSSGPAADPSTGSSPGPVPVEAMGYPSPSGASKLGISTPGR